MDAGRIGSSGAWRSRLSWTAFIALIVLMVVALNWPVTFTTASTRPASSPRQSLQQEANATEAGDADAAGSIQEAADRVNPAVVTITNLQPPRNPFTGEIDGSRPVRYGVGSGFIIDDGGHVVTNSHVIAGGTAFEVEFIDGSTTSATLVGSDQFQDVAVLKLDLSQTEELPGIAAFGDSETVRPGDRIAAIGTPYGEYANHVSEGVVEAVDLAIDVELGFKLPNLIQHNAPIYEGNSGGPLVDEAGTVIGMNVAKALTPYYAEQESDVAFAIAGNAVKAIVDEILASGRVARPYLGIVGQPALDGRGHVVERVEPDAPAAEAGLRPGDLITAIGEVQIDQRHPLLNELIFKHRPGDAVELTIERNGAASTVDITLAERPLETV